MVSILDILHCKKYSRHLFTYRVLLFCLLSSVSCAGIQSAAYNGTMPAVVYELAENIDISVPSVVLYMQPLLLDTELHRLFHVDPRIGKRLAHFLFVNDVNGHWKLQMYGRFPRASVSRVLSRHKWQQETAGWWTSPDLSLRAKPLNRRILIVQTYSRKMTMRTDTYVMPSFLDMLILYAQEYPVNPILGFFWKGYAEDGVFSGLARILPHEMAGVIVHGDDYHTVQLGLQFSHEKAARVSLVAVRLSAKRVLSELGFLFEEKISVERADSVIFIDGVHIQTQQLAGLFETMGLETYVESM